MGVRETAVILLATLALVACHKRDSDAEDAASARGLQVEAYDPVIPKAPIKGKLDTLASHPEDAAAAAGASSEPAPADSSQPPAPKG